MTLDKNSLARRKQLRARVQDRSGDIQVAKEDLLWLLDECGRLQQGNDRLRRQNRRLRLRLQGAGIAEEEAADGAGADDADAAP